MRAASSKRSSISVLVRAMREGGRGIIGVASVLGQMEMLAFRQSSIVTKPALMHCRARWAEIIWQK